MKKKEKSWPQKDMLKLHPKLAKSSLFRLAAGQDQKPLSEKSQRAYSLVDKRFRRVSRLLNKLGATPQSEPMLTERMLRVSEADLDSWEERLLKEQRERESIQ